MNKEKTMAKILKGKPVAEAIDQKTAEAVGRLGQKGITPKAALIRVGERPDDKAYESGIMRHCENLSVAVDPVHLPETITQTQLIDVIKHINTDNTIHGCLIFKPLPKHIDEDRVAAALDPKKDIDGMTPGALAGVFLDRPVGCPPCTAQACMDILDYYHIPTDGKKAVVLGRSPVIGKPVAMMLLKAQATVTICHSHTQNIADIAKDADILIAAVGRGHFVVADFTREGQTVLDVGINFDDAGNMIGDVDFEAVSEEASAITPVPGGIGTVTTAVLVHHVVMCAAFDLPS